MKTNLYKFALLTTLSVGTVLLVNGKSWAGTPISFHSNIIAASTDVGTTIGRLISTAVKYFLSDDTAMEAELVWKDGTSCGGSGCGGCYGGSTSASGETSLSATLADISIETDMYQGKGIEKECVADLAQQHLDASINEQENLKKLNEHDWQMQYRSQRRSIQAMTDALNMKRLYNEIKDVATSIQDDYSNYSAALSTVASKRLLLDQLLSLKKRVIAARLRTRAQTLEIAPDIQRIQTCPNLTGICGSTAGETAAGEGGLTCKPKEYMGGDGKCHPCGPENTFVDNEDLHTSTTCNCITGYTWSGSACVQNETEGEE